MRAIAVLVVVACVGAGAGFLIADFLRGAL